jgi:ABC-2 type transport system ATP-binding protein
MATESEAGRSGAPALSCQDLVVRYGARTAVDRVSLSAQRGEVLCILGPNGAGKTSTIECFEGYRRPAAGAARVVGLDPWRDRRALADRIGVMLQRGGLYPMLAPRRALRLFASYYAHPEEPETLLDLVRLREVAGTPWRHLSGGEQARLSLALALVGRPEVVFLDEPTAGVDPEGRLGVREVITNLRERGVCVLLTTHELAEAERLADQVVILHHGVVAAAGTPVTLAASAGRPRGAVAGGPRASVTAAMVRDGAPDGGEGSSGGRPPDACEEIAFGAPAALDTVALSAVARAPVVEEGPGRYRVTAPPDVAPAALAAVVTTWLAERGLALYDLRVGRSLEEAYLAVVGATGATASEQTDDSGEGGRGRRARERSRRASRADRARGPRGDGEHPR